VIVGVEEAGRRLAELVEKVNDDRIAVRITSPGGNAVLVAEEYFAAWQQRCTFAGRRRTRCD
jgi:prevent-host-death family protein